MDYNNILAGYHLTITEPHTKKELVMTDYNTIYVGIDAHKNEHTMYITDPYNPEEGMRCTVKNNSKELQRFISRLLKKFDNPIRCTVGLHPSPKIGRG